MALEPIRASFHQAFLDVLYFHLSETNSRWDVKLPLFHTCDEQVWKIVLTCKLMRTFFSSSSALDNCLTSCLKHTKTRPRQGRRCDAGASSFFFFGGTHLCWLFSSSTEALRSLSWFLSSSSVVGVRGECRVSGEGAGPEEEDGEEGRWPEFGRGRTGGLVGSCALSSTWGQIRKRHQLCLLKPKTDQFHRLLKIII